MGSKVLGGVLAALALLAAGLLFLPAPGGDPAGSFFAALWLLITGVSALAFGRELWMLLQLNRIRSQWKRVARTSRLRVRKPSGVTRLRERERRLD